VAALTGAFWAETSGNFFVLHEVKEPLSNSRAPLLNPTAIKLRASLTAIDVGVVEDVERPFVDKRDVRIRDGLPILSGLSLNI